MDLMSRPFSPRRFAPTSQCCGRTDRDTEKKGPNMDVLKELEIYIPSEAVVKQVLMNKLPKSLRRRIHQFQPKVSGSQAKPAIWISPVKLRKKGWRRSRTGSSEPDRTSSLLLQIRSSQVPLRMPFVTANNTAYQVLQGTVHDVQMSSVQHVVHHEYQEAVVIYDGTIYLSIRVPNHSQKSKPFSQAAHSSTSNLSPSDQEVRPGINSSTTSGALQYGSQAQLGGDPQTEQVAVELSDDELEPDAGQGDSMEQGHSRPEMVLSDGDVRELRRESTGAPGTMVDYQALEKEEKIAQVRAKLQKKKAAVNKLMQR